jgi:hypothetical protein
MMIAAVSYILLILSASNAETEYEIRGYKLPASTIPLNSTAGIQILANVTNAQHLFTLLNVFETQQNQAFCSVATSVVMLNALSTFGLASPTTMAFTPFPFFTQNSIFAGYPCVTSVQTRNGAPMSASYIASGVSLFKCNIERKFANNKVVFNFYADR